MLTRRLFRYFSSISNSTVNTVTTEPSTSKTDTSKSKRSRRLTMADRVMMERHVTRISQISDTAEARVRKQASSRTAHRVLPLSNTDQSTDQVRLLARQILLRQRARTRASWLDKHGIPRLKPVNGMGHFILPLQRIHLQYCSHAGDALGMREFLTKYLYQLAEASPSVEFVVEPRWGRFPLMRAHYLHGCHKVICVRNLSAEQCLQVFQELLNSSGQTLRPFHQQVKSSAPAIRSIWSPFHMQTSKGKNDPLCLYRSPKLKSTSKPKQTLILTS